nr:inositol monophosphatase family protein [Nocardiopsis sinuspersici]
MADAADRITLGGIGKADLEVREKPDSSLVTGVDIAVEQALLKLIDIKRPGDTVISEEMRHPHEGVRSGRCWIIDPLDHTSNYIRGIPVYGTLIALEDDGEPVVGMVSAPGIRSRWWAHTGRGAYANGDPIHVSRVSELSDAYLTIAAPHRWDDAGLLPSLMDLTRRCRHLYGSGGFWGHMLVAEGRLDISLDPWGMPWDLAAVATIVSEAGGRFSDLNGKYSIDNQAAVLTNGILHETVLGFLGRVRG